MCGSDAEGRAKLLYPPKGVKEYDAQYMFQLVAVICISDSTPVSAIAHGLTQL
jgi:hypothetical protein